MSLGAFTVVIVLFVHSIFMNECDSLHVLFWQTMPDSSLLLDYRHFLQ
jgi:hypothetical protein